MTKPLQVTLEGKGTVTLRPNDHIATGGEGSIYRVGDLAVKVYLDPDKMRATGLPEKVKLLSTLTHPYVVGPRGMALNSHSEPVGHYLPFVDNGHALSMVFTNEFWAKESFDNIQASKLVAGMREAVEFAHQHAALLIDANELNWMALLTGKVEPRVIDVDSWAIGRWGASVIMPSIRDWNAKDFNEGTDWFAWGIVTFQLYTGIHPFKGTLAGYDRGDLVGRMKARASVFSAGIKLNRAVRDFSGVPSGLLRWYEAVFQGIERAGPPSPYDSSVTAAPAAVKMRNVTLAGGDSLVFEKILTVSASVVRVFGCGVALTSDGELIDLSSKRRIGEDAGSTSEVVRVEHGWLAGDKHGFWYLPENGPGVPLSLQVQSRSLVSYENRLFAVTESGLTEITARLFSGKPIASVGQTWGIMVNSTRWFSGVGVLDAMGAMYLIAPQGDSAVIQLRVKELDGFRVVAGKAGNRFVSLITIDRQGDYRKFEFTFGKDHAAPPVVWSGPADSAELNLAILPKGVCATILKDGELDIFVPSSGAVRRIEDRQIATDMALANWNNTVVFVQNGEVWSVKVK
jgi:hypothetical protein